MEKFIISPEDCLILKAFKDSRSLREAAGLLDCDPAGLARKVQNISSRYGFLQKVNNRWQVTDRGLDLVAWTEASIQSQKSVFSAKKSLRIASTMWLSEEVLIPNLNRLKSTLGNDIGFSFSVPNKGFEMALIDGSVDLVVACHPPLTSDIQHRQLIKEKWVVIIPSHWKLDQGNKNEDLFLALKKKPFIHHSDINKDLFFPNLSEIPDSGISIDNLIGIRSAVASGLGWSLVPELLVLRQLKQGQIKTVPFKWPVVEPKVCIWWLRNRFELRLQASRLSGWLKEICE